MDDTDIPYGPVKIIEGPHKGRIGYYDDTDTEYDEDINWDEIGDVDEVAGPSVAIVYFGSFFVAKEHYLIPFDYIRTVTTDDLMKRREELSRLCGAFTETDDPKKELVYLTELHYVESTLIDRMIEARFKRTEKGRKIFISHSSTDKPFARWIATDLKAAGHTPWLDEWDIEVGESIPKRVSEGIAGADFVIVVLSENAVNSKWVENEWHAKYWDEIESGKIHVLPALYKDCELPALLKTKKYADFRNSYNDGLYDILSAINSLKDEGQVS